MSRAFTKEDSWEEPIVPQRAPLPEGVPNYVTPRGLALLRAEHAALESERAALSGTDDEGALKKRGVLARRIADVAGRISTAQLVDPVLQTHEAVRFGTRVTLRERSGDLRMLRIVGVDESDPEQGLVAFTAPIARAILGSRVGDTVKFRAGVGDEPLVIVAID